MYRPYVTSAPFRTTDGGFKHVREFLIGPDIKARRSRERELALLRTFYRIPFVY